MNDKSKGSTYGVITEQGDLGLGFSMLQESEQKKVKKSVEGDKTSERDRGYKA